jgi:hypothetical protein
MAKEKMSREVRIKVQEKLYEQFRKKCERDFKTVSIVMRELMMNYLRPGGNSADSP